jgi:peptide methionine sulfoxide reductase MsrB
VVKVVLGVLAFLAGETTYAGIPENISKQVAVVQAMGGEWLLRYVELPLLGFVLLMLAIGPARVRKSVREGIEWYRDSEVGHGPEAQGSRLPTDEDLRERCCNLSAEIFDFHRGQQEDLDKRLKSDHRYVFLHEEPYRSQWRAEETERHEKGTVDRYSEQFGGKVSDLCDDLEPYGWCSFEERKRFESPTGTQDIRYTAQRLEVICRKSNKG